jgi:hypothetical protein
VNRIAGCDDRHCRHGDDRCEDIKSDEFQEFSPMFRPGARPGLSGPAALAVGCIQFKIFGD